MSSEYVNQDEQRRPTREELADLVVRLRDELGAQWGDAHDEHCGRLPHPTPDYLCRWPRPAVLDEALALGDDPF